MDSTQNEQSRPEHFVVQDANLVYCLDPVHDVSKCEIVTLTDVTTPAWVWSHFLSEEECANIIATTNTLGYGCTAYNKDLRGNLRLICDDPFLAEALWQRVQKLLPKDLGVDHDSRHWVPCGVNSRFRFSKYYPGDRFSHHCDDCVILGADSRSMYTLNVYLNDNDAATRIYVGIPGFEDRYNDVTPKSGVALVFQQLPTAQVLHEGRRVTNGHKYLMRSDIMFKPVGPSKGLCL